MDPDIAVMAISREKGYVLGIILGYERKNEYFIFGTDPEVLSLEGAKKELLNHIDNNVYWFVQR